MPPSPIQAFTPGKGPVGPLDFDFRPPIPGSISRISGVTRDSAGNPLGNCVVKLFRLSDNLLVDQVVSDGAGNYILGSCSPTETYYAVAYKAGSPDVTGATANTLVGS
jgi:hypothetical protein